MKKILTGLLSLALVLTVASVVKAEKPSDVGFSDAGYNLQANIFNGTGLSWCQDKLGYTVAQCEAYLGPYTYDNLIMKWNDEWVRGNDENWSNPPYKAWENNEWNGAAPGGSGSVWHYKIVWVGAATWNLTGNWGLSYVSTKYPGTYPHTLTVTGGTATGASSGNTYTATVSVTDDTVTIVATYLPGSAAYPYTYTAVGTISGTGTLSGTWTATDGDSGTWYSTSGSAVTENGPYWKEGGYRIWGIFETIMDQGIDSSYGPGHFWFAHAIPTGYGAY